MRHELPECLGDRALRSRVAASIRRGVGVHARTWRLAGPRPDDDYVRWLREDVHRWCEDKVGKSRGPSGIDQVTLALAWGLRGDEPVASVRFNAFRPAEFYAPGGVADGIDRFVCSIDFHRIDQHGPGRLAVALVSWGDVAREVLLDEGEDA